MQAALVGVADVHAGTLSNGFKPFELIDFRRVVLLQRLGFFRFLSRNFSGIRHKI